MADLSAFLSENALAVAPVKVAASSRFLSDEGEPILWEIGCITGAEDELIRKGCVVRVPAAGRRGQMTQETDYNLYLGRLAARCTRYPNLSDEGLQNSYGVMGEDALLKAMLTPGEYAEYLLKVQEINGFDVSFTEAVDEAKN